LWRAGGFATAGIAALSAVVGSSFVASGAIRRASSFVTWGSLLLLINVLPFVIFLVMGQVAGLPDS
jgi:hypothetical protein